MNGSGVGEVAGPCENGEKVPSIYCLGTWTQVRLSACVGLTLLCLSVPGPVLPQFCAVTRTPQRQGRHGGHTHICKYINVIIYLETRWSVGLVICSSICSGFPHCSLYCNLKDKASL